MTLDSLLAQARAATEDSNAHRCEHGTPWLDDEYVCRIAAREPQLAAGIAELLGDPLGGVLAIVTPRYSAQLDAFELMGGIIMARSHMRAYAAMLLRAVDEVPQ